MELSWVCEKTAATRPIIAFLSSTGAAFHPSGSPATKPLLSCTDGETHQQQTHCGSAQMVRETEMEPTASAKRSTNTRPSTSPASSNPPSSIPAWLLERDQKPSPRNSSAVCGQDQCSPRSSARSRRAQGNASSQAAASSYHKLSLELIKSMSGSRALGLPQLLELVQRQILTFLWQVAVAVAGNVLDCSNQCNAT